MRRALLSAALLALLLGGAACGRLGFDVEDGAVIPEAGTDAGPHDGAMDDAAGVDAGDAAAVDAGTTDAGMVDGGVDDAGMVDSGIVDGGVDSGPIDAGSPIGPFPAPTPIAALASGLSTDDPSLTGDLLELFFNRSSDIYVSTRATVGDTWSAPTAVTELNSGSTESSPEITTDGLRIYFSSQRGGNLDIYFSTRATRTTAFTAPVRAAELSSTMFETNPTPRTDGLEMMLGRGASSSTRDIYHSTRATIADLWGTPELITELSDGAANDAGAMLALGGTLVIFFSDRGGESDLYYATRATTTSAFGPVLPVDGASGPATSDEDPWISEDGHYLVFARDGQLFETTH